MEFYENDIQPERAFLVSVDTGDFDAEASMNELYELIRKRRGPAHRRHDPKTGAARRRHLYWQRPAGGN